MLKGELMVESKEIPGKIEMFEPTYVRLGAVESAETVPHDPTHAQLVEGKAGFPACSFWLWTRSRLDGSLS